MPFNTRDQTVIIYGKLSMRATNKLLLGWSLRWIVMHIQTRCVPVHDNNRIRFLLNFLRTHPSNTDASNIFIFIFFFSALWSVRYHITQMWENLMIRRETSSHNARGRRRRHCWNDGVPADRNIVKILNHHFENEKCLF